jgi:transcriptional regulator with XRE-family HTH domain
MSIESGKRIRQRRRELNLTQEQLGEMTGYTMNSISLIEMGKREVPLKRMSSFAEALNCSVNYIMCGYDNYELGEKLLTEFANAGIVAEEIDIDKLQKVLKMYKIMNE